MYSYDVILFLLNFLFCYKHILFLNMSSDDEYVLEAVNLFIPINILNFYKNRIN